MNRRNLCKGLAASVLLPSAAFGQKSAFPDKPVKVIVPLGTGSGGDATMRFFADGLRGVLGQSVVVENFPGGNGAIAAAALKRAAPDGYTLLQGSTAIISLNPVLVKNLPYDPSVDFKPIHGMSKGVNVLVASTDSKFTTFPELIEEGQKSARPLNIGTYSPQYQLAAAWLASTTKVKLVNIPYKGASAALNDLVGRSIDLALTDVLSPSSLVASGKVRILAVSGETRHPKYPNVPTIRESGFEEYVNYSWSSLYAPADVPDAIVNVFAQAMRTVIAQESTKAYFSKNGSESLNYGPAEMRKFQVSERQRFERIAAAAGIQPQ